MEKSEISAESRLKPYKKDFDISYSCGVFPTCELLAQRPESVLKLLLTSKSRGNEGVEKAIKICEKHNIPVVVDDKTCQRLYPKDNVYAIGVFKKYDFSLEKGKNHVVLVNPSDMGNLGTIMRTMCAFGIFDLGIIQPACDYYDPKVIRSSMGAVFKLRIRKYETFSGYEKQFSENRQYIPFMLDGQPMETVKLQEENFTLIMGNEAAGLPPEFAKKGTPARIMHLNTVDSLNLPIATGIGIYYFCNKCKNNG